MPAFCVSRASVSVRHRLPHWGPLWRYAQVLVASLSQRVSSTTNEPDYDHLVHERGGVPHAGGNQHHGLVPESQGLGVSALLSVGDGDGGVGDLRIVDDAGGDPGGVRDGSEVGARWGVADNVEAPPDLQGLFDDFFQRPLIGPTIDGHTWIGDVGFAGPDKGKGGTYVLLPPDYNGEVPKDGFVYRSRTYNVFLFWRAFFGDPNDLSKPDATIRQTRVYPLGKKDQAKPMVFPDGNAQPADLLFPQDGRFFDMLSRFIDAEYVDPADLYMRGMLHTIGIEKGKPFNPDPATKTLLDQAAKTGFKMTRVIANDLTLNAPGGRYFPDRQWINVMAGQNPFYLGVGDTYIDIQQQSTYFTEAYGMSPGMVVNIPDKGAKYPGTFRDKDGDFLDGGKSYVLHIPPKVPATRFWSVTLYDSLTASGIDNGQPFPSINLMDKPAQNADGSFDLYFGPTAPAGKEKSWIRTLPGKGFFVLFRFYSPEEAFLNGSWKLDDVVKVK